jgi:hypothetical protein
MKETSRAGSILRTLSLAALAAAALSLWEGRAWADGVCGGGYHPPRDSGTGSDAGDGSTLGLLRGPAGPRRKAGAGLVLGAGLGGAWLASRRKQDGDADGDGDGGGNPPTR